MHCGVGLQPLCALQSSPKAAPTQWLALALAGYLLWPYLNQNSAALRWIRNFLQRRHANMPEPGNLGGLWTIHELSITE